MSRHARGHIEEALRRKFPGATVLVEQQPDGLRVTIEGKGTGTLIAISGDEPNVTLAGLLAVPDKEGQE